MTALDAGRGIKPGRPREMGMAAPGLVPGRGMQAILHAGPHEHVIGRVELHRIDPVAPRIVRAQLRRVLVGEPADIEPLRRSPGRAEGDQALRLRVDAAGFQDVEQGLVGRDEVHLAEGRRLVEDLVRVMAIRHGAILGSAQSSL